MDDHWLTCRLGITGTEDVKPYRRVSSFFFITVINPKGVFSSKASCYKNTDNTNSSDQHVLSFTKELKHP